MKITITIDIPDDAQSAIDIIRQQRKEDEYETLADVPAGAIVYTVPWAIYTINGFYYISVPHGATKVKRGTRCLPILMSATRDNVLVKRTDLAEALEILPDTVHEMGQKWHDEDLLVGLI